MYMIIANWHTNEDGEQYTISFSKSNTMESCFDSIDQLGNPFDTTYKVFDPEVYEGHSFAHQRHIRDAYLDDENLELDFKDFHLKEYYARLYKCLT